MWRKLVELYSVRAREFAEEAARLGQHAYTEPERITPELLELWREIKKRHNMCDEAGEELARYIESHVEAKAEPRTFNASGSPREG